jgi:hypothetical protein
MPPQAKPLFAQRSGIRAQPIRGTQHAQATAIQDMRVHHGRPHILVPQQLLHRPDVVPGLQQMRRSRPASPETPTARPTGAGQRAHRLHLRGRRHPALHCQMTQERHHHTLNRNSSTSPSCTTYSLPFAPHQPLLARRLPAAHRTNSSYATVSARMKPRSKVRVDHPGRGGGLVARVDGPCADFLLAGGEVARKPSNW